MKFEIKRVHIILGIVLACSIAWGIFCAGEGNQKAALNPAENQLSVQREPRKIAFTFDDGPHPETTERHLKILSDYRVPSTFFVVGKRVEQYPELVQKIFSDGHEIANHTYSHRDLRRLSKAEVAFELEMTDRLVSSITDQKMKYFRPPGGRYDETAVEEGKNLGYEMVLWTVFPGDHANPSKDLICERVLKSVRENGVVLFHSGIENTLEALPGLIDSLRKQGYSFVTLSEMGSKSFPVVWAKIARKRQ
jgi:peptidoglycan/xylan/chitin deacetylase (PgdA/CDA1 family)